MKNFFNQIIISQHSRHARHFRLARLTGTGFGFAPEAELALELIGLPSIPLMAFGKLEYLASQYGLDPAALVKPSPFQALAAMLAAWTGEEWPSLQAANQWHKTGSVEWKFQSIA